MKKLLLIVMFTFVSQFAFAQTEQFSTSNDKAGLSDADFLKAKEDYLNLSKTELYKVAKEAIRELGYKISSTKKAAFPINSEAFKTDKDFSEWIAWNLQSTKFKTAEEAIALRKLAFESREKLEKENSELYELLKKATGKQLRVILKPDFYKNN